MADAVLLRSLDRSRSSPASRVEIIGNGRGPITLAVPLVNLDRRSSPVSLVEIVGGGRGPIRNLHRWLAAINPQH